jgi:circadian clock protein KaiB
MPNSIAAEQTLRALCRLHAPAAVIEVIDVVQQPERALQDAIIATPTLLRLSPAPVVRLIGSLAETERVRRALNFPADA